MKKNKGFTLVEVMVTVAVMGVLAGIVGITMGVLLGQRVKSMAADTKSVFQSTQIASMSRDDAYIRVTGGSDDVSVIAFSSADNKINSAEGHGVKVYVSYDGHEDSNPLNGSIDIRFNRQTGGLLPGDNGKYVTALRITNGTRSIKLQISKLTGKVTY